jgi:hypothetical protein
MSDTNGKVKIHPHPERNEKVTYKPYVPQYQVEGVEPSEYHGAVVPGGVKVARPSATNPREGKRPTLRQPYALAGASPVGRGPVPNVGNNMEHTWPSVDGDIVDDLSGEMIDPNHEMVDNNEFMTDQALGYQSGFTAADITPNLQVGKVEVEMPDHLEEVEIVTQVVHQQKSDQTGDLMSIVHDLEDDSYLLIVTGVPVCSGPKEEIEEQAFALHSGEHEMCDGNPVPLDDIVILKRVKVRVGLFLE